MTQILSPKVTLFCVFSDDRSSLPLHFVTVFIRHQGTYITQQTSSLELFLRLSFLYVVFSVVLVEWRLQILKNEDALTTFDMVVPNTKETELKLTLISYLLL